MKLHCKNPILTPILLTACVALILSLPGNLKAQTPLTVDAGPDQSLPLEAGMTAVLGTTTGSVGLIEWIVVGGDASKIALDSPATLGSGVSFTATGVYTLQLRVANDTENATDTLTITVFDFRPDIRIGPKRLASRHKGNNVYNQKGKGQHLRLVSRKNKPVTFYFSVENDGTATDQLKVRGSRISRSRFDVLYLDITGKRRNVTAAVQVHKYTQSYEPGEIRKFCGTISRRLKAAKRNKIKVNPRFKVTSLSAPANLPDVADAELLFKY